MNPLFGVMICITGMFIICIVITTTLKYTSRWNQLERFYLAKSGNMSLNSRLTSLRITTSLDPWGIFNNFNNMVFIGSDEEGVCFSMIFPFRLILRPIFIPWDEIIFTKQSYIGINRNELILTKLPETQFILTKSMATQLRDSVNI